MVCLRLHYSVNYYRLAILPFVILTLFVKYVFPSAQISAIPLKPHLYSSSCFILCRFKTKKQVNSREFVNRGFRSVVVITSASHAEGRQFKSGRKQERYLSFFSFSRKRHIRERFSCRKLANPIRLTKPTLL